MSNFIRIPTESGDVQAHTSTLPYLTYFEIATGRLSPEQFLPFPGPLTEFDILPHIIERARQLREQAEANDEPLEELSA